MTYDERSFFGHLQIHKALTTDEESASRVGLRVRHLCCRVGILSGCVSRPPDASNRAPEASLVTSNAANNEKVVILA